MKYLVITNHSYMLWQFRKELIEELLKKGEVVISVPFGEHIEDFEALGCRMVNTELDRRGINPLKDLKLYKAYKALLKAEKPDMVITYSIKPNVYAGYACRRMNIPYCVNVQGLGTAFQKIGLAQMVTVMYRTALKKAKTVFFENEGNANLFIEKKIIDKSKVTLLDGAGINLRKYAFSEYPKNEKIHFLYLGRIMREKGMDELFGAVRTLKNEGYGFVLDLVGFFEDEYKSQVEALEQDGIAVFHGFQKNPIPFYEKADCVILPSYHEGMSNVLLESASVGRPIITSDIYGCREAVLPDESGFLCKVKDTASLTDQMRRFCQMDYATRKAMGEQGRKHMEQKFEKSKVVNATLNAIMK